MGIARPKSLTDLPRLNANLRVTCPSCGRSGVYPAKDVIAYFIGKGWNLAWDDAGSRFRCDGGEHDRGCGTRGARLGIEPASHRPVPPPPEPTMRDRKIAARRERS